MLNGYVLTIAFQRDFKKHSYIRFKNYDKLRRSVLHFAAYLLISLFTYLLYLLIYFIYLFTKLYDILVYNY